MAILMVLTSGLSGVPSLQASTGHATSRTQTSKPVVQLFTTHPDQLYHLTFSSGGSEVASTLATTATHPFWVVEKQAFVPASELQPGDDFLTLDGGYATLVSIRIEHAAPGESFTTHNFEVADFNTYFAGSEAVWVHNRGTVCERLFALIDRRARQLGKTHHGNLESLRFQAMTDVKNRAYTRPGFDSPWWSRFGLND